MSVFKCKMCGGTISFTEGATIGVCDYCGTKQTLPRLDNDKKANLYDRADHFRRNNEFDKAMEIYEHILHEDSTDAESYWSIVLCRFGIEYVEDPKTHKRIPTVNRAQLSSIYSDENYKNALNYADPLQKEIYEAEAKAIDDIQKGILEISAKEKPFDIFICYKESDVNGRRTKDSVYAQDIYKKLTEEGYRVFFARITLEDKLGEAYEPYIFAALNSAKVMIVVGTNKDNFNAVWVKNEWSRYLALINSGAEKTLIPVYTEMDAYDLPGEFAYIQAQDMSKIGFMQDLLRGIEKIVKPNKNAVLGSDDVFERMITSAYKNLAAGEFENAERSINAAMGMDSTDSRAIIAELMLKNKIKTPEDLPNSQTILYKDSSFSNAVKNADPKLKEELIGYSNEQRYRTACKIADESGDKKAIRFAAAEFGELKGYKESEAYSIKCADKLKRIKSINIIIRILGAVASVIIISMASYLVFNYVSPVLKWRADIQYEKGEYEKAIELYERIPEYKGVDTAIEECKKSITYNEASVLYNEGKFEEAKEVFTELGEYNDSKEMIDKCQEGINNNLYNSAVVLLENKKYDEALKIFDGLKKSKYKDSEDKCAECRYMQGTVYFNQEKYSFAITEFSKILTYKDSQDKYYECNYRLGLLDMESGDYFNALERFAKIPENVKDCTDVINECNYCIGVNSLKSKNYKNALNFFYKIPAYYKDTENRIFDCYIGQGISVLTSSPSTAESYFKKVPDDYKAESDIFKSGVNEYAVKLYKEMSTVNRYDSSNIAGQKEKLSILKKYDTEGKMYSEIKKRMKPVLDIEGMWRWREDKLTMQYSKDKGWHEDIQYWYYMQLNNGKIGYGTNIDKSTKSKGDFWYNDMGTYSYSITTKKFTFVAWTRDGYSVTYDGKKIRTFDGYGDPESIHFGGTSVDAYATQVKSYN